MVDDSSARFAIACREVIEILSFMPTYMIMQIPFDVRNNIAIKADKKYITKVDPYKKLDDQDISEDAKSLLAYIYKNYLVDEDRKKEIDSTLINNDIMYEKLLKEKYDVESMFKAKSEIEVRNYPELKKKNIFSRLLKFLLDLIKE